MTFTSLLRAARRSVGAAAVASIALAPAQAAAADCPAQRTLTAAATSQCTVPQGFDAVFIGATGGHGAASSDGSGQGGPGDYVGAWYRIGAGETLQPGTSLQIVVGDDPGGRTSSVGGGGAGASGYSTSGGAGGGATSIAVAGQPLLVAGGGGGGGGSNTEQPDYDPDDSDFGGGAGGAPGAGGAQGDGEGHDGHEGFRDPAWGGTGGGGADGGNPGGGGLSFSDQGSGGGTAGSARQGGDGDARGSTPNSSSPAVAGGGGGGGGYRGGGGGGAGDNVIIGQRALYDRVVDQYSRGAAGGGGGGSDLVADSGLTVAQRTSSGGSSVVMRFQPGTPTALTAPSGPVSSCAAVPFTAAVDGTGSPGGTVTLTEAGQTLASAPVQANDAAAFSLALGPGTHTVVASYSGDVNDAPGDSEPVTQQVAPCQTPTTTEVTSSNPAAQLCAAVTLTATVAGRAPTGIVTFSDGGSPLAQAAVDATGRAAIAMSDLAPGTHTISAAYSGDRSVGGDFRNASSVSSPFAQIVEADGPASAPRTQCGFSFPAGTVATVPVPSSAVSMTVTARGGNGAGDTGVLDGATGGSGDILTATLPVGGSAAVPAGGTLSVVVGADAFQLGPTPGGGGAGAFGGPDGGRNGGGGGGATSIAVGRTPVLVAGGGGGSGGQDLGGPNQGDGGATGHDGGTYSPYQDPYDDPRGGGEGGGGATTLSPGLAPSQRADAEPSLVGSVPGTAGAAGQGGAGGAPAYGGAGGGGGGGGGLYGGGGGDAGGGGGGGGASFVTPGALAYDIWSRGFRDAPPSLTIGFSAAATSARAHSASVAGPRILGLHGAPGCVRGRGTSEGTVTLAYRLTTRATMTYRLRRSRNATLRTHCARAPRVRHRWSHGRHTRRVEQRGRHRQSLRRLYGNLRPGTYRLSMYATDISGRRSPTGRVTFSVAQPGGRR